MWYAPFVDGQVVWFDVKWWAVQRDGAVGQEDTGTFLNSHGGMLLLCGHYK